jgi:hypothetical protein
MVDRLTCERFITFKKLLLLVKPSSLIVHHLKLLFNFHSKVHEQRANYAVGRIAWAVDWCALPRESNHFMGIPMTGMEDKMYRARYFT